MVNPLDELLGSQAVAHAALLQQLGSAVRAFVEDVADHGHGDRMLVMSFSEFGRRVAAADSTPATPIAPSSAAQRSGKA